MRLRVVAALILIPAAVALAGCTATARHVGAQDAWTPSATCPSPASVAATAHLSSLEFAHAASREQSPGSTGCTYQTGRNGTQVTIATQPGSPTGVVYNTAAGVTNNAEPSLGTGAHVGTSSFFCGIAVPATDGRALAISILPPSGTGVDCSPLRALLKSAATPRH